MTLTSVVAEIGSPNLGAPGGPLGFLGFVFGGSNTSETKVLGSLGRVCGFYGQHPS